MTLEQRITLLEYRQELLGAEYGKIKYDLFVLTADVAKLQEQPDNTKEITKLHNRLVYLEKLVPDVAPKSYSWQLASLVAK